MELSFRDTKSSSIHQKTGTSAPSQKTLIRDWSNSTHRGHIHNLEELQPSSLQKEDPQTQ